MAYGVWYFTVLKGDPMVNVGKPHMGIYANAREYHTPEVRGTITWLPVNGDCVILPTSYFKQHVKRAHARTTPTTKTAAILLQCPAARANLRAYTDDSNIATVPSTIERLLIFRAAESDETTMMICNMVMVIFKRKKAAGT